MPLSSLTKKAKARNVARHPNDRVRLNETVRIVVLCSYFAGGIFLEVARGSLLPNE